MSTHSDAIAVSPFMMRKLGKENRELGVRLAQVEFHNMLAELENPRVFDLQIDFPNPPADDLDAPFRGRLPACTSPTWGRR